MAKSYEELKQHVENTRSNLMIAEQKITANQDTLDLFSDKPVAILNCKNVFKKVKVGATIEDGPFNVNCECFDESEGCCNRKCDHYAYNLAYMSACDELLRAKDALNNFKQLQR